MTPLEHFTHSFTEALLWASYDDDGTSYRDNFTADDIAPESLDKLRAQCEAFYTQNLKHIHCAGAAMAGYWEGGTVKDRQAVMAGHDFLLTRDGHGAGFWDGDWPEPAASILTEASEKFGEVYPYVGDDGKVYVNC